MKLANSELSSTRTISTQNFTSEAAWQMCCSWRILQGCSELCDLAKSSVWLWLLLFYKLLHQSSWPTIKTSSLPISPFRCSSVFTWFSSTTPLSSSQASRSSLVTLTLQPSGSKWSLSIHPHRYSYYCTHLAIDSRCPLTSTAHSQTGPICFLCPHTKIPSKFRPHGCCHIMTFLLVLFCRM